MKVVIESKRRIKPIYEGNPTIEIPLTVFDKVTYNSHIACIYAYRPPTPPNATLEYGLRRALSEYRELAGRLEQNEKGDPVILLNDKGAMFIEASADSKLDEAMPTEPSAVLLGLYPCLEDHVEELLQVQLTKFACGSLVIGFTSHHMIADGHAISNFLVSWGKGLDSEIMMDSEILHKARPCMEPLPLHKRNIFNPRSPPQFMFEHKGVEYKTKDSDGPVLDKFPINRKSIDGIINRKFTFTVEILSKLKASANERNNNKTKPYTTFESLVAHLWRTLTMAHGVSGPGKIYVRISVDGRKRMNPRVPNEFFGNLVLWTHPTARVDDLLREPLSYSAQIIHDSIAKFDHNYFQSFVDFASHKVEEEGLVPMAESKSMHADMDYLSKWYPNFDIISWLNLPFNDLDFGGGCPYLFMPFYFPMDGFIILAHSLIGDGSIVAFISLFEDQMATFEHIVYSID